MDLYKVSEAILLTLCQTSPGFSHVCCTSLLKTLWEKEKLLVMSISPFPTVISTRLENILLLSSNLKLSSAKSESLEESESLGKD